MRAWSLHPLIHVVPPPLNRFDIGILHNICISEDWIRFQYIYRYTYYQGSIKVYNIVSLPSRSRAGDIVPNLNNNVIVSSSSWTQNCNFKFDSDSLYSHGWRYFESFTPLHLGKWPCNLQSHGIYQRWHCGLARVYLSRGEKQSIPPCRPGNLTLWKVRCLVLQLTVFVSSTSHCPSPLLELLSNACGCKAPFSHNSLSSWKNLRRRL